MLGGGGRGARTLSGILEPLDVAAAPNQRTRRGSSLRPLRQHQEQEDARDEGQCREGLLAAVCQRTGQTIGVRLRKR